MRQLCSKVCGRAQLRFSDCCYHLISWNLLQNAGNWWSQETGLALSVNSRKIKLWLGKHKQIIDSSAAVAAVPACQFAINFPVISLGFFAIFLTYKAWAVPLSLLGSVCVTPNKFHVVFLLTATQKGILRALPGPTDLHTGGKTNNKARWQKKCSFSRRKELCKPFPWTPFQQNIITNYSKLIPQKIRNGISVVQNLTELFIFCIYGPNRMVASCIIDFITSTESWLV